MLIRHFSQFSLGQFLFLFVFLCGCAEDVAIRTYTVAKKDSNRKTATSSEAAQMLGVIVPHQESAWFFKLTAPPDKVDRHIGEFRALVESLTFSEDGTPQWQLSDEWSEQLLRQIVYAKFTHKSDGVSATVTQLPAETKDESSWHSYVLDNVNRWRGQLNLAAQNWDAMQPELEELPAHSTESAKAYFVSITGKQSASGGGMGMRAPFLEQMRQETQGSSAPSAAGESDGSSAAIRSEATTEPAQAKISFTTPEGWEEQSASGIRMAHFEVKEGDSTATVSVSTATGDGAKFIEMWFGQLQVEPTAELLEGVVQNASMVSVNSVESRVYLLEGSDGQAIRVASIPWNDRESLFVKMTGAAELVDSQQDSFEQFLKSISW